MFSSRLVLSTRRQHDLLLLVLTSLAWLRYVCLVSPRRSHSFSPLPLLSSLGVTVCSRVWGGRFSSLPFLRARYVHELFRMLLHEGCFPCWLMSLTAYIRTATQRLVLHLGVQSAALLLTSFRVWPLGTLSLGT